MEWQVTWDGTCFRSLSWAGALCPGLGLALALCPSVTLRILRVVLHPDKLSLHPEVMWDSGLDGDLADLNFPVVSVHSFITSLQDSIFLKTSRWKTGVDLLEHNNFLESPSL